MQSVANWGEYLQSCFLQRDNSLKKPEDFYGNGFYNDGKLPGSHRKIVDGQPFRIGE